MTESQRFLDIDQLRVAKLEKLRNVEAELERQRRETQVTKDLLSREHGLCESLADQNRDLLEQIESLSESLETERKNVGSLSEQFKTNLNDAEKSNETLIGEYELKLLNSQDIIDSLRQEVINLNGEVSRYQTEAKTSKSQLNTRTAELNEKVAKLSSELESTTSSTSKTIKEQRLMIDQLTNSMSEAATQLMEAQSYDQITKSEIDDRNRKIDFLEEKIDSLHEIISEKDNQISAIRSRHDELSSHITELHSSIASHVSEKNDLKQQVENKLSEITVFRSKIKSYETAQNKLMKQMDSLPIINKRLEADCGFLRDDLKTNAEKLKQFILENESLTNRLQVIESLLTPDQRAKLSQRTSGGNRPKSEATVLSENKRLLVEAMELRMRLVDSQAARDKAQSTILEQSQMIAKLQQQTNVHFEDISNENEPFETSPVIRKSPFKKHKQSENSNQECVQQ